MDGNFMRKCDWLKHNPPDLLEIIALLPLHARLCAI